MYCCYKKKMLIKLPVLENRDIILDNYYMSLYILRISLPTYLNIKQNDLLTHFNIP